MRLYRTDNPMTPYDPQTHHRRSMRLKGYNYAQPGAYFITLVTYQRQEIFGRIVDGDMELSALGQIAHHEWVRSSAIRQEIHLHEDEFVLMPNHIHGIVWIVGTDVGADSVRPNHDVRPNPGVRPNHDIHFLDGLPIDAKGAYPAPLPDPDILLPVGADGVRPNPGVRVPRSLSSFIAGYKAAVTSRAHRELNMTGIWQRNYYDHIIRAESEFIQIRQYIDANPLRWQDDQLHPSALTKP